MDEASEPNLRSENDYDELIESLHSDRANPVDDPLLAFLDQAKQSYERVPAASLVAVADREGPLLTLREQGPGSSATPPIGIRSRRPARQRRFVAFIAAAAAVAVVVGGAAWLQRSNESSTNVVATQPEPQNPALPEQSEDSGAALADARPRQDGAPFTVPGGTEIYVEGHGFVVLSLSDGQMSVATSRDGRDWEHVVAEGLPPMARIFDVATHEGTVVAITQTAIPADPGHGKLAIATTSDLANWTLGSALDVPALDPDANASQYPGASIAANDSGVAVGINYVERGRSTRSSHMVTGPLDGPLETAEVANLLIDLVASPSTFVGLWEGASRDAPRLSWSPDGRDWQTTKQSARPDQLHASGASVLATTLNPAPGFDSIMVSRDGGREWQPVTLVPALDSRLERAIGGPDGFAVAISAWEPAVTAAQTVETQVFRANDYELVAVGVAEASGDDGFGLATMTLTLTNVEGRLIHELVAAFPLRVEGAIEFHPGGESITFFEPGTSNVLVRFADADFDFAETEYDLVDSQSELAVATKDGFVLEMPAGMEMGPIKLTGPDGELVHETTVERLVWGTEGVVQQVGRTMTFFDQDGGELVAFDLFEPVSEQTTEVGAAEAGPAVVQLWVSSDGDAWRQVDLPKGEQITDVYSLIIGGGEVLVETGIKVPDSSITDLSWVSVPFPTGG